MRSKNVTTRQTYIAYLPQITFWLDRLYRTSTGLPANALMERRGPATPDREGERQGAYASRRGRGRRGGDPRQRRPEVRPAARLAEERRGAQRRLLDPARVVAAHHRERHPRRR